MKRHIHLSICCIMASTMLYAVPKQCTTEHGGADYSTEQMQEDRTGRILSGLGESANGLANIIVNPHEKTNILQSVGKILAGIFHVAAGAVQKGVEISPEDIETIHALFDEINEEVDQSMRESLTPTVRSAHEYLRAVSIEELNAVLQRAEEDDAEETLEDIEDLDDQDKELQANIIESLHTMLHDLFNMVHNPEDPNLVGQNITDILSSVLNIATQALKYEYLTSKDAEDNIALYLDNFSTELTKEIRHLMLQTALNIRAEDDGEQITRSGCCKPTTCCKTSCCKQTCCKPCCKNSCKTNCCKTSSCKTNCKPCCRTVTADDEQTKRDEQVTRSCKSGNCCKNSCKTSCCKTNSCKTNCKPCCRTVTADDEQTKRDEQVTRSCKSGNCCKTSCCKKDNCKSCCKNSCKTSCCKTNNCKNSCKPCCRTVTADDEQVTRKTCSACQKCSCKPSCKTSCNSCKQSCCGKTKTITRSGCCKSNKCCKSSCCKKDNCKPCCKTSCKSNCCKKNNCCKPCCRSVKADDEQVSRKKATCCHKDCTCNPCKCSAKHRSRSCPCSKPKPKPKKETTETTRGCGCTGKEGRKQPKANRPVR